MVTVKMDIDFPFLYKSWKEEAYSPRPRRMRLLGDGESPVAALQNAAKNLSELAVRQETIDRLTAARSAFLTGGVVALQPGEAVNINPSPDELMGWSATGDPIYR